MTRDNKNGDKDKNIAPASASASADDDGSEGGASITEPEGERLPTLAEAEKYKALLKQHQDKKLAEAILKSIEEIEKKHKTKAVIPEMKEEVKNVSMANKVVTKIPKFGIDPKVTWDHIMVHLRMVSESGVYSGEEMKLILFQAFEGAAFDYIAAHPELMNSSYAEVLSVLNDVYGKTRNENIAEMSTIVQGVKEKVDMYEARIINAAGRLKPEKPSIVHVKIDAEGVKNFITNPNYDMELATYRGQEALLTTMMITHFINGLRPEIRRQMKPEEFVEFDKAKKAAKLAERFLEQQGVQQTLVGHMAALNTGEKKECNAISRERGREQLAQMEGKDGNKGAKEKVCYRCDKPGHIARNCPELPRNRKGRSPNRSGSPGRFSPGRGSPGRGYQGSRGGSPGRNSGRRSPGVAGYQNQGYGNSGYENRGYNRGYTSSGGYQRGNSPGGRYSPGRRFSPGGSGYRRTNFDRNCGQCRQQGRSCSRHRRVSFGNSGGFRPRSPSGDRRFVYNIEKGEPQMRKEREDMERIRNYDQNGRYEDFYYDPKNC